MSHRVTAEQLTRKSTCSEDSNIKTSRPRKLKMLYQVAIIWQQREKFCKFSCNGRAHTPQLNLLHISTDCGTEKTSSLCLSFSNMELCGGPSVHSFGPCLKTVKIRNQVIEHNIWIALVVLLCVLPILGCTCHRKVNRWLSLTVLLAVFL